MDIYEESLELHKKLKGKIKITSASRVQSHAELALVYTPGVAEACRVIAKNEQEVWSLTGRGNMVAVITDGSAVLGLGDIGPAAALPVMEGKCALFSEFAGISAVPIALSVRTVDEIVGAIVAIAPSFGAINLEDISAPRCFEVEEKLKSRLNIPVMHDDQHGTAIVVAAGLLNASRVVGKKFEDLNIVINGAGAAGAAIMKLLFKMNVRNITMLDSQGIITSERAGLDDAKQALIPFLSPRPNGDLTDALKGADVFVGVSKGNVLTAEMVQGMSQSPIIFALANPVPEIMPDVARSAGAAVIATGRSDFPNQINNVLAYPGVFRGVLDARISVISDEMKVAAARALATLVETPAAERIIPDVFDPRVVPAVAAAVQAAATSA